MSDLTREELKESIKKRVPESLQGDNTLAEYLDVCGDLFYELKETIKQHDHYNDYRYVPEARLSMLARKFAFDPPRNIPESMLRGIIRDIVEIHMSKGVENSLLWVFRLLGWGAEFKEAWLLNPERFEPNIKKAFPQYYESKGTSALEELARTVTVNIGQDYIIGIENQLYKEDPTVYIDGHILFGRNQTVSVLSFDPLTPDTDYRPSTEFTKLDYRNFLFGSISVKDEGTFFNGRRYFQTRDTYTDLRIIGEYYNPENTIRKSDVVMKTPYLIVEVDNQDYTKFIEPYQDDEGNIYSYTELETFKIAETLISYFLYESVRPANVKIIVIVAPFFEQNIIHIGSELSLESEAVDFSHDSDVILSQDESMTFIMTDENFRSNIIGDSDYIIGAPSYHPINSWINTSGLVFGDERIEFEFVGTPGFQYTIDDLQDTFEDDGTGYGILNSRKIHLRTPSWVTIDGDFNSFPLKAQIQKTPDSEWVDYDISNFVDSAQIEFNDWLYLRLVVDPSIFLDILDGATIYADFTSQTLTNEQGEAPGEYFVIDYITEVSEAEGATLYADFTSGIFGYYQNLSEEIRTNPFMVDVEWGSHLATHAYADFSNWEFKVVDDGVD